MNKLLVTLLICSITGIASASICDHTPSKMVGSKLTSSVAVGAGAAVATGVGLKTAGLYVITNAVTGATMLGSTAAGASAAGTAGILTGTAGAVGTVGAALLSPFVIIPAAIVVGGIATYEGGCYLAEKK
jgi:hypothetical protein